MKSIYMIMVRKRWYIFLSLIGIGFLMNLFLWNETSQLIRALPSLHVLKQEAEKGSYELRYQKSESSVIQLPNLSDTEKEELYILFSETFSEQNEELFYNRLEWMNGGDLIPVTNTYLEDMLLGDQIDITLLEDLLIRRKSNKELRFLEEEAKKIGLSVEIVSIQEVYYTLDEYYKENFWFGFLIASLLCISSLFLLRWIVKSAFKLCIDEMRSLRILGMARVKLVKSLTLLFLSPVFLGILFFLYLVTQMDVGIIIWDYLYLVILNALVGSFVLLLAKYYVFRLC